MYKNIINKKLVAFDLDGTLARSKTPADEEMIELLNGLLSKRKVAVIGGGWFPQFKKQLLESFAGNQLFFDNLFLFPTSGAAFLKFEDDDWREVYSLQISDKDRQRIKDAFEQSFIDIDYKHPEVLYGEVIEDRGTQITFSALGQQAPIGIKTKYKGSVQDRRVEIAEALKKYIPEFEIKIPGKSSIDVTLKGINKGYGIRQIEKYLGVKVEDMIFIGDALYPGGNDEPVKGTGIDTIAVKGPEDTKRILSEWLIEI